MADFKIKPAAGTGNKLILQTEDETDVLTTSDSGVTLASATLNSPTLVTPAITGAVSGDLTVSGDLVPSTSLSHRNMIINGGMTIDQRGVTSTINATGVTYNVDRWLGRGVGSSGVFTLVQDSTSPADFTQSLEATVTTAESNPLASGSSYRVQQIIEGYNVAHLNWGSADAKSVILSFWVKSSVTGTFGGSVANGDYNRFNPFSYTISSTNWEKKEVTINGDTSGTWATNNGLGIRLNFSLGAGSSKIGTAGTWTTSALEGVTGQTNLIATNSATFYLTGVQLELGSNATPFEHRSYGEELLKCERYYENSYLGGQVPATSTHNENSLLNTSWSDGNCSFLGGQFRTVKRAPPTIILRARGSSTTGQVSSSGTARSASASDISEKGCGYITVTSGTATDYTGGSYELIAEL